MRRPQGYAIITDPYAPSKEMDTFTCVHCNGIVFVQPAPAPMVGGFCRMCMANVCDACSDKGCTPFLKKIEVEERREKMLRAVGI